MRLLRAAVFAVLVTAGLVAAPTAASAQIDSVTIGTPRLGPEGGSVTVPVTTVCDQGFNVAFADVTLAQSTGHRLATGFGEAVNPFPGVPCTGAPQTLVVTVDADANIPFKQGKAAVRATMFVFNPETFDLPSETVGPVATRIRK
jgi:hypothetical protein